MMKVCKFGGTSVASAEQMKKVAAIVQNDSSRKMIVVSAPGKRFTGDIKVTDLLFELGRSSLAGEKVKEPLAKVVHRYA